MAKVEETKDEVTTLSAKEAAIQLGTDGRTLRKFLRSKHGLVGQGNRWAIDPSDIDSLRAEFEAFNKPKKEAKVIVADPVDDEDDDSDVDMLDEDFELELDDEDENEEVDELTVD